MSLDTVVPVIDLSGWVAGDAATRERIGRQVDDACRTVGFMQIVGHGIPQDAIDELTAALDEFFGLAIDHKQRYCSPRPSINRGYTAPRSERLSYSLGVASPDDLFEAYNVGITAADFPDLTLDDEVYAANIWPDLAPAFRHGVWGWFEHAAAMARIMEAVFAVALGLRDDYFASFTDHSIDVLRVNHYVVPDGITLEPRQLGMGAHTDYGIVTILWADAVPGLEIMRPDGTWLPVVPATGALLINIGDLLARWTNDRWLSTMHRVVPPRDHAGNLIRRRSAALFHDGNADALIETLDPCRDADGASSYEPVTVAQHLADKLGGSRGLELNENASRDAARVEAARP